MFSLFGVEVPAYVDIIVSTLAVTWPFAGFAAWWFARKISLARYPKNYANVPFAMHLAICAGCVALGWFFYLVFLASSARTDLREINKARPP